MSQTVENAEAIIESARQALRTVLDPEFGLNVVDMGLLSELRLDGNLLRVRYKLTSPTCPVGGMIAQGMRQALEGIPDIMGVEMQLVDDPPWSVAEMTDEGRHFLGMQS